MSTSTTSSTSINNIASDELLVEDAYARVKGAYAALPPDQLLSVNLDVQMATETVLGNLKELRDLRARMAEELPRFDLAAFDKLEDVALALRFVQSRYVFATKRPDDLNQLLAEGNKLRERLTADAKALSLRGLFDTSKLASLKGGQGYRNAATDLQALATELRAIWPTIEGKCGTSQEDLKAATQLSTRLTRVVGVRGEAPSSVSDIVEERRRAFTLLIKTWDATRAAVAYVRREEDDADNIAPNLYTGKAKRAKASEEEDDDVPAPPAPAAPPVASTPSVPAPATSPQSAETTEEIRKRGPFVS
jgi:hypothetical protein